MGIRYSNVLMLRDAWTSHDLESCSVCPDAIAKEQPSNSIIDNYDLLSDTLTGGGHLTLILSVRILHVCVVLHQ